MVMHGLNICFSVDIFLWNRCYSKHYTLKINFNKYYYLELWFFTIQLHVKIELDGFWVAGLYHNSLVRVNVLIIINPQCTSSLNKSLMNMCSLFHAQYGFLEWCEWILFTIFCGSKLPSSHWQISLFTPSVSFVNIFLFFSSERIFFSLLALA